MAKITFIIDIPGEDDLRPFYDIWDGCIKDLEKRMVRAGVTGHSISKKCSGKGSINDLVKLFGDTNGGINDE